MSSSSEQIFSLFHPGSFFNIMYYRCNVGGCVHYKHFAIFHLNLILHLVIYFTVRNINEGCRC